MVDVLYSDGREFEYKGNVCENLLGILNDEFKIKKFWYLFWFFKGGLKKFFKIYVFEKNSNWLWNMMFLLWFRGKKLIFVVESFNIFKIEEKIFILKVNVKKVFIGFFNINDIV